MNAPAMDAAGSDRNLSLRRRVRRAAAVPCLLIAITSLGGCPERPVAPPNLLLITIDTLRPDHLGAWGYSRGTSPAIDRLAREGVVFENAYAQSSWTLPSLATLLTSTYTSTHECWTLDSRLRPPFVTLAEHLHEHGYRTAGIASHVFLLEKYGLHQGFDEYDTELIAEGADAHRQITSPAVSDKATAWLDRRGRSDRPFFLWVHYFDPHAEYREHGPHSPSFGTGEPIDLYDGEIAFTDRAIGRLLDQLDRSGLGENTVVVVTADHGEEFGEHGGGRHGKTLYGEVTRVPLVIRAPGFAPRRVVDPIPSVDVLPTLLELLGVDPLENVAGRSAVALMKGEPVDARPIFTELRAKNRRTIESLILGQWKIVRPKSKAWPRLFDLEADPGERRNVSREQPDTLQRLADELDRLNAEAEAQARRHGGDVAIELSPEELDRLRELGYVQDEP